jgi:ATP-dependent helicase YprA (DUF1998 family)
VAGDKAPLLLPIRNFSVHTHIVPLALWTNLYHSKTSKVTAKKMKRKLNENDEPSSATPAETLPDAQPKASFADLGLEPRLLQAIAHEGFLEPTLVQRKGIPLALNGKDVLAKAKTGSGKTAAYVLPIIQSILKRKQVCSLRAASGISREAPWHG